MSFIPIPGALFAPYSSSLQRFAFKPIQFDMEAIGLALNSKNLPQLRQNIQSGVPKDLPTARDPAIIAPWEINKNPGSLNNRVAQVRALQQFISTDPRLADIKLAKGERSSQNLFALYKALDSLQTLAQYASDKNTSLSSLERVNAQFQQGINEVKNFLPTATFNKLSLFFGEKQSNVQAPIGLGADSATYEGKVIQKAGAADPLAGIVGNEQFTIKLVKNGTTTVNVNIDLSGIVGTVSVNSVVAHINAQIAAQAPTFQTIFEVTKDANFDYGIGISGSTLETVEFIPTAPAPALYVVSDFLGYNTTTQTGTLTKLNDVLTTPTRATPTVVAGVDTAATAIAKDQAAIDAAAAAAAVAATKPATTTTTTPTVKPTADVAATTTTSGVATDSQGFVYVLGQTKGDFAGQFNAATGNDVFLNKYNSLGELVQSKLVGTGADANAYSITVDSSDNVIIAGQTSGHLLSTDAVSGLDSFVTKYDKTGKEIFTYQLDTVATDYAASLAVDANGDIFMGGVTSGAINSTSGFGGIRDGVVLKLDGTTGSVLASQLIGGAGNEQVKSIAIASNGDVAVSLVEDGNAIVRVLDATNLATEKYNLSLGAIGAGTITDTYIDNDQLYVVGYTDNSALNAAGAATTLNAHAGATDGFVFNATLGVGSATSNYVTYFGGTGTDKINDVTFSGGNLYIAGGSSGSVNGQTPAGLNDSFVASLNATTGATNYVQQFGQTLGTSTAQGVAFVANGTSVLDQLGLPSGLVSVKETRNLINQTSLRDGDSFFISVNGGAKRRVTIEGPRIGNTTGDTFASLVSKINRISTSYVKAEEVVGDNGKTFKISAQRGATIELFSGNNDKDALVKMGLEPGRLMSAEILANIDPNPLVVDENDLGGTFALGLVSGMKISDKTSAKYALTKLEGAIAALQRAYRSQMIDPIKLQLLEDAKNGKSKGAPPPYLTARIANFQDALNRLQSNSQSSSSSLFI